MATREIQIISTEDGSHHILLGLDNSQLSSFYLQMYLEKKGTRAIEFLQSLSLGFCSFIGGNIYLHNSNDVPRCNFFGEQKVSKVGVVMNEEAGKVKVLDSLGIGTDGQWEVESLVIPASQNYPNGMYSRIPDTMFEKRESGLYSEFMRNMKTTSSTIKAIEAMTGEELRGHECYLLLSNSSEDKVQLWEITINMTKSR